MTSPFKSPDEFEKELTTFANKFRTTIADHSKRISDYFEMSCYNMIVRYYELQGFSSSVQNLVAGRFKFKCSPTGLLDNFSYIRINKEKQSYRIYHNASVQSAYDASVYTTPDIVVTTNTNPTVITDYYKTKQRFSFFPNSQMVTFCEAKHFMPFPELMISFIGTVNELKPSCLKSGSKKKKDFYHIAPSLMMSGCLSVPSERIVKSLQRRYYVNLLSDLFIEPYSNVFSLAMLPHIATLTKKGKERG